MTKQSPILPEPCVVNAAAAWDEGYSLLPGEVLQSRIGCNIAEKKIRNPYSDVRLNCKKSAEAIVP
jgi:hypothetical protein